MFFACGKSVVTTTPGDSDSAAGGDTFGQPGGDTSGQAGGDTDGAEPAVFEVTSVSPSDGATGIALNLSQVQIVFSAAVDSASVIGRVGVDVGGVAFEMAAPVVDGNRISLSRVASFESDTEYVIWVDAEVSSVEGVLLGERFESSFRTFAAGAPLEPGAYGMRLSPIGGSAAGEQYTLHVVSESISGSVREAAGSSYRIYNAASHIKVP